MIEVDIDVLLTAWLIWTFGAYVVGHFAGERYAQRQAEEANERAKWERFYDEEEP